MTNPRPDASAPWSTRRRILFVAAIVVAVAIVAALVITGIRSGRPSAAPSASDPLPSSSASEPASFSPPPSAVTTAQPAPTTTTHAVPHTAKPVPITGTVTPVAGVTAKVTSLTAIQGKGSGVGEISGPAIKIVLSLKNGTGKAISLSDAIVSVSYGSAATPADELVSQRVPLPTSAAPGATVSGTFEFTLATADRSDVTITLDYGSGAPLVAFTGSAPR